MIEWAGRGPEVHPRPVAAILALLLTASCGGADRCRWVYRLDPESGKPSLLLDVSRYTHIVGQELTPMFEVP